MTKEQECKPNVVTIIPGVTGYQVTVQRREADSEFHYCSELWEVSSLIRKLFESEEPKPEQEEVE